MVLISCDMLAQGVHQITVQTDDSKSWCCAAYFEGRWFHHPWWLDWITCNIMPKELLPVILSCSVWGPHFASYIMHVCTCIVANIHIMYDMSIYVGQNSSLSPKYSYFPSISFQKNCIDKLIPKSFFMSPKIRYIKFNPVFWSYKKLNVRCWK